MTIFGFNTDVKHGDGVYHVQSEARQNDLLLQTLVFVKGQCVGKHTVSYAQKLAQPGFSSEAMHELLKTQHKNIIDAIQQGRMDSALGSGAEVQDVGGSGLALKWATPAPAGDAAAFSVRFEVLDSGQAVSGAEIVVRPCSSGGGTELARAVSNAAGAAEVSIPLTEDVMRDSAVMVQASHAGKSATRKLRVKK
jgi:hypothetical protein